MAYKVEIRPIALEDLKQIEIGYMVQFGVETALKVNAHIPDTLEWLEEFLDSGSKPRMNAWGYWMVICGKHVVVYRLIGRMVYIYHIADTQTEHTKLFY